MTIETEKNIFEQVFEEKIEDNSDILENPILENVYIKKMISKMCDNCVMITLLFLVVKTHQKIYVILNLVVLYFILIV